MVKAVKIRMHRTPNPPPATRRARPRPHPNRSLGYIAIDPDFEDRESHSSDVQSGDSLLYGGEYQHSPLPHAFSNAFVWC